MKPLPLPLRVAAGLAVTAAERARDLPKTLLGLPVTVISGVLQFSMRMQQHVTELAIRGDDALASLRPVEEEPSWATFDEDLASRPTEPVAEESRTNGHRPDAVLAEVGDSPWEQEERALGEEHVEGEFDSPADTSAGPLGLGNYDELSLPQLRARLRRFSLEELEELLAYERAHENRAQFVGMLARRITNVQRANATGDADAE
ncbi:lipid droplet-associated protein [Amycolatopsis endophytica]|uniref:DUF8129 domain-containing protein n=1 Tax=Amycolatopsis endophytica TaxID=860233 RepID=A0A853B3Y7_9PSEU|nr:lipid droplet-associated protein [Amycolatopsis endophytica]NYI89552.1 hypothetical protein [Amycolatopsis endophytica]